jgi:hypothetical protein
VKTRKGWSGRGRAGYRMLPGMLLLGASSLWQCGGGAGKSPTAPTIDELILEQQISMRAPDRLEAVHLVVARSVPAGLVSAVIDWQQASQDVRLYVTNSDCPGGLLQGTFHNDLCSVFAQVEAGSKPRRASFTNDQTRSLGMFVSNYGPGPAEVTLTVYVRPTPAGTATATPAPSGSIRYLGSTLPEGSTVAVLPMGELGQQAPELSFRAVINLPRTLSSGLVQAFVRTDEHRCMGGGRFHFFPADTDVVAMPGSMSHVSNPPPPCVLPYTTTHVEFVVLDGGQVILSTRHAARYHFVAAP